MSSEVRHLLEPLVFFILVGFLFAPLERLAPAHGQKRSRLKMDVAFGTLGALLVALLLPVIAGRSLGTLWSQSILHLDRSLYHHGFLGSAAAISIGLVVFEFMGYLYHRAAHALPVLWRLHRVHHSAETMDWLASFRQHPLEIVLMTLVQNAPLVLMGLSLGDHTLVLLLLKVNTVFVHSNLRIPDGLWSHLIAVPQFHHTHHRYGDTEADTVNYASLFPWIDRLFGTYSPERGERFGLPETTPTSFWRALVLARR